MSATQLTFDSVMTLGVPKWVILPYYFVDVYHIFCLISSLHKNDIYELNESVFHGLVNLKRL